MTKILKIEAKGFKSFANKTELLFGDSYNCILGPNGSGKSNVLDALCFVLGKGSAKGLRVEKAANLIYNGGKKKQPAKEGEVAIYFDNEKKEFPLTDTVIKISRLIKQSGQSKYLINNQVRTRQQILDLLASAKINPDGYNIILQGDIVRFCEMSPEERRKIIEEIAGISIYEEKKEKALRELEKVDGKLTEADIVLAERKTYLQELKKDRDQALKYKDLKNKIDSNRATLLYHEMSKRQKKLTAIEEELRGYATRMSELQKEISNNKAAIQEKKDAIEAINKEVEEKGEKEQVVIHKQVEQLKIDIATGKNRVDSCQNEINRINQRKQQLQQNLNELEQKTTTLRNEQKDIEERIKKKTTELDAITKALEEFKKKNKINDAGTLEQDIEALDKEAEERQGVIHKLREEQQEYVREKDRLEFQVQSVDERIAKVVEVQKQHTAQLDELKVKKERFKACTLELNKCLNEDSLLASQTGSARQKLLQVKEELAKLQARNATIMENIAGGTAIQRILALRKSQEGIYGTVSELGNVQSKYAQALEVAAGPKIKSIVVETDKIAADCIKFLRTNRLGVVTFLPLNKVTAPHETDASSLTKTQGVHGLAVSLVSYQPKFKKIFSYVFGSTLVVDTIDVARRIGVGKARMVTLDGDLLELSGAMQGGYRDKKRLMGFQESEITADITKYERDEAELTERMHTYEQRRTHIQNEISRLREEKATHEGEIIKMEKSLHLESGDLDVSKKLKEEFLAKVGALDKNIDAVQRKISDENKHLAQLKIKKQQLRTQVSEMRSPALLAQLNTYEQKKQELREGIQELHGELKNIDTQTKTILGPEQENILKILKQHKKEEEGFLVEMEQTKSLILKQEKDLKDKEKSEQEFYAQFKQLFTKRNKVSEALRSLENELTGREEQIRSVELKNNMVSLESARLKAELAGYHEEQKQYKDAVVQPEKPLDELKREISEFEKMVADIGNVNLRALEVYDAIEREYQGLLEKKDILLKEKVDVVNMMKEIEDKKKSLFMKTYEVIVGNFKNIFSALTWKGEAFLHLENEEDPFVAGVRFQVRISGKKFLDIRSLSGGEKTLTALAFIFAIQEHEPASFYVLDEVDAALDKHNSEKFAKLIRKYANGAQYIIISHNDAVISEADNLYGISMNEHGMSKVVSLKI
ncbi:chromosome segregation protein SMC [Candidatus Woesearchaeota archaeon]|nr:chromosome segregation protein SMC [Candidatus Woesearchaeota archaeon]